MHYLSCLPDPRLVSTEDCEKINTVMQRLSERYSVKVESVPACFKIYPTPENCRKHIIYTNQLGNEHGISERHRTMILNCCMNEYEKQLMENCLYSHGENGRQTLSNFYYVSISAEEKWVKNEAIRKAAREKKRLEKRQAKLLQQQEHITETPAA